MHLKARGGTGTDETMKREERRIEMGKTEEKREITSRRRYY